MIEWTHDYRRVKRLAAWDPIISREIVYLIDKKDNEDHGLWSLHKWLNGFMIHADMGSNCSGKEIIASAKEVFSWVFRNLSCEMIYAMIPKENKPACHIAAKSGMTFINEQDNKRFYEVSKWAT